MRMELPIVLRFTALVSEVGGGCSHGRREERIPRHKKA